MESRERPAATASLLLEEEAAGEVIGISRRALFARPRRGGSFIRDRGDGCGVSALLQPSSRPSRIARVLFMAAVIR
jgi:hypothetical protein